MIYLIGIISYQVPKAFFPYKRRADFKNEGIRASQENPLGHALYLPLECICRSNGCKKKVESFDVQEMCRFVVGLDASVLCNNCSCCCVCN